VPTPPLAPWPDAYPALLARLALDPAAPLITDLDLIAGTRVELSVASACNGVAKAAHLFGALSEDLGRPPRLGLALPPHWQSWTLAMGAWAIGAELIVDVDVDRLSSADLDGLVLGPNHVSAPPPGLPDTVWISRLHPFGLPFDPAPSFPLEDLTTALRAQPDEPPPPRLQALPGVTPGAASKPAVQVDTMSASLGPSARILTVLPWTSSDGLHCAFTLPLQHRRGVIVVRDVGDDLTLLARTAAGEGAVVTAGVDLPGHPRIA
jgi:uncharacterized protein (TIGR03089 family)